MPSGSACYSHYSYTPATRMGSRDRHLKHCPYCAHCRWDSLNGIGNEGRYFFYHGTLRQRSGSVGYSYAAEARLGQRFVLDDGFMAERSPLPPRNVGYRSVVLGSSSLPILDEWTGNTDHVTGFGGRVTRSFSRERNDSGINDTSFNLSSVVSASPDMTDYSSDGCSSASSGWESRKMNLSSQCVVEHLSHCGAYHRKLSHLVTSMDPLVFGTLDSAKCLSTPKRIHKYKGSYSFDDSGVSVEDLISSDRSCHSDRPCRQSGNHCLLTGCRDKGGEGSGMTGLWDLTKPGEDDCDIADKSHNHNLQPGNHHLHNLDRPVDGELHFWRSELDVRKQPNRNRRQLEHQWKRSYVDVRSGAVNNPETSNYQKYRPDARMQSFYSTKGSQEHRIGKSNMIDGKKHASAEGGKQLHSVSFDESCLVHRDRDAQTICKEPQRRNPTDCYERENGIGGPDYIMRSKEKLAVTDIHRQFRNGHNPGPGRGLPGSADCFGRFNSLSHGVRHSCTRKEDHDKNTASAEFRTSALSTEHFGHNREIQNYCNYLAAPSSRRQGYVEIRSTHFCDQTRRPVIPLRLTDFEQSTSDSIGKYLSFTTTADSSRYCHRNVHKTSDVTLGVGVQTSFKVAGVCATVADSCRVSVACKMTAKKYIARSKTSGEARCTLIESQKKPETVAVGAEFCAGGDDKTATAPVLQRGFVAHAKPAASKIDAVDVHSSKENSSKCASLREIRRPTCNFVDSKSCGECGSCRILMVNRIKPALVRLLIRSTSLSSAHQFLASISAVIEAWEKLEAELLRTVGGGNDDCDDRGDLGRLHRALHKMSDQMQSIGEVEESVRMTEQLQSSLLQQMSNYEREEDDDESTSKTKWSIRVAMNKAAKKLNDYKEQQQSLVDKWSDFDDTTKRLRYLLKDMETLLAKKELDESDEFLSRSGAEQTVRIDWRLIDDRFRALMTLYKEICELGADRAHICKQLMYYESAIKQLKERATTSAMAHPSDFEDNGGRPMISNSPNNDGDLGHNPSVRLLPGVSSPLGLSLESRSGINDDQSRVGFQGIQRNDQHLNESSGSLLVAGGSSPIPDDPHRSWLGGDCRDSHGNALTSTPRHSSGSFNRGAQSGDIRLMQNESEEESYTRIRPRHYLIEADQDRTANGLYAGEKSNARVSSRRRFLDRKSQAAIPANASVASLVTQNGPNGSTPLVSLPKRRSLLARALRLGWPLGLSLLLLLGLLVYLYRPPLCCHQQNNWMYALSPHLNYVNGPPPS